MPKSRILNISINLFLVVFTLTLILGATEYFFYLNSTHNWIENKTQPLYPIQHTLISDEIISAANKLYPSESYDKNAYELKNKTKSLPWKAYSPTHTPYAINLINDRWAPKEPVELHEARVNGTTVIYNKKYNMSKDRTRLSSHKQIDEKKKNFLALGCSYVFGVGVDDDQTITGQLAKISPNYNFFNLGVPGGGLTNALTDIYFKDRIANINKNGGIVVYTFWWDHFRRFFWNVDVPHHERVYFEIKDGKLIRSQPYQDYPRFVSSILNTIENSHFLRYVGYGVDFYSQENQRVFIDFIQHLQEFYEKNYNLDFYFYFLNPESSTSEYFVQELKNRKIKTISYQSIFGKFEQHELTIGGDGHFNEKANYIYAREIQEAIRKNHSDF